MSPEDHAEDLAKELAGNWQKFSSFAWSDEPEDGENWCIVYTSNRDSGLVDQSNAAVIAKELDPFIGCHEEPDNDDVREECHRHWAVGYVNGYAIRVYRNGEITDAFRKWSEIQAAIEGYPLLDESDYSQREYDDAIEAIEREARDVSDDAPSDWPSKVFDWLWDNDQRALENVDDHGASPTQEQISAALVALGFAESDDDDDDGGDDDGGEHGWTPQRDPA